MIISQAFYIFGMIALFCVCVVDLFIWLVCVIGEDSRSVSKESEMSVSVDSESCTADVHLPEGGITALAGRCSYSSCIQHCISALVRNSLYSPTVARHRKAKWATGRRRNERDDWGERRQGWSRSRLKLRLLRLLRTGRQPTGPLKWSFSSRHYS